MPPVSLQFWNNSQNPPPPPPTPFPTRTGKAICRRANSRNLNGRLLSECWLYTFYNRLTSNTPRKSVNSLNIASGTRLPLCSPVVPALLPKTIGFSYVTQLIVERQCNFLVEIWPWNVEVLTCATQSEDRTITISLYRLFNRFSCSLHIACFLF